MPSTWPWVVGVLWEPSGSVSLVARAGCYRSVPWAGGVRPPVAVEPSMLLAPEREGWLLRLMAVRTGRDCHGAAAGQGLILWSRIRFSWAPVPAESTL